MRIAGKGNKSKRGYTIIELLFVVIVIAVLAAAGIAMYLRSLDKARASEGLAILSSVRTHYLVEYAENDKTPPDAATYLTDWQIDTSMNKWWIEKTDTQDGNFTANWLGYSTADPTVTLVGNADTIVEGVTLTIKCDDGYITQTYP